MKTQETTKTYLTIEEVLKQGNSSINQEIKGMFVQREVYANVNSMVEYILNKGFEDNNAPFTINDISNYYSYPDENLESEPQEVFEWYLVSSFLAEK